MTQNLSYYALPHLAVAAGETTNQKYPTNTHAWSTLEKDVVVWNGSSWQLPGNTFARFMYGITGITETSFLRTALTGGEEGANTGFSVVVAYIVHKLNGASERDVINNITASSSSGGWYIWVHTDNSVYATLRTLPAPGQQNSNRYRMQGSEIGRVQVAVLRYNGTVFDLVNNKMFTTSVTRQGTAYNPPPASLDYLSVGSLSNSATQGLPVDISFLGALSTKTYLTNAQVHEVLDTFRETRDFPTSITGATVAHRYSVRESLRKQTVRAGQVAPLEVPSSATGLAVDALKRSGTPVMSALDLNTEGRVAYGLTGWTHGGNFYAPYAGLHGILGAAEGFWVSALITYRNGYGPASFGAGFSGWTLQNGSAIVCGVTTPALTAALSPFVPGAYLHLALRFTGNEVQYFINGLMVSRIVFTGVYQHYSSSGVGGAIWIGQHQNGNPGAGDTVFGVAGGHFIPTDAEMLLAAQNSLTSDHIQAIPGKTEHLWDCHQDIIDSGDFTSPPTWLRDRIGTHHAYGNRNIRLHQLHYTNTVYLDEGIAFGLSSTNNPMGALTSPAGGLPGSVSGFWLSVQFLYFYTGNTQSYGACWSSDSKGWGMIMRTSPIHSFAFGLGNGTTTIYTPNVTITPYAGSTPVHFTLVYDGAGTAKVYHDGVLSGTVAVDYIPAVNAGTHLGLGHSWGQTGQSPQHGMAGGNFIPTDAEVLAAATASKSARRIQAIPGKTTRLWSYVDDRAEAGNRVPAYFKERIEGELVPLNDVPLSVTRRVKRNWSYETQPLFYGVTGFSGFYYAGSTPVSGNWYESVPGYGAGWSSGFWMALMFIPHQTTVAAVRTLASAGTANTNGWDIRTGATNTTLNWGHADNAGVTSFMSAMGMGTADYNKIQVFFATYDPASPAASPLMRQGFQRNVSTPLTRTGYTPPATNTMRLGRSSYDTYIGASDNSILGFAMGRGVLGQYDMYQVCDLIQAQERFQGIPGKTELLVDITQDVKEASLAVPTTLKNRINGQVAFNLNGTLSLAPVHHRSFGW